MKQPSRLCTLLTLALVALAAGLSQPATASAEASDVDWKAQWIWQEQDGPANTWVAFRRVVELETVPETVIANVSADSKYWLWINGELVVFEGSVARGSSPARPWERIKEMWTLPPEAKPTNTWYEEVDLSDHLRPGKNTLAVLAWHWGRETHKGTHIDSGKGGFLLQADLGDRLLVTDDRWKAKAHPAYDPDSGDVGNSVVQDNVKYDAREAIESWNQPGFDDSDWHAATPKGTPPTAPWYALEKNYVPAMVNHGLQNYPSHPESAFPFVSDGEVIRARLPFNKQITPYFEIEGEAGQRIEIGTDNRLNKIHASYTTREGEQSFESLSWMNGHEILYTIPKGVKVLGLKYRWMSVGEMVGSFETNDPYFNRLWDMGVNTLFVCARDNFMDCPDRERALWIGDVADQASYLFYCMDEAGRQLLKKSIRITMDFSHEGVYAGLGPLRLRELPGQSLQFIEQAIWQHYLNTGDEETLRYAYPHVRDYLKLWRIKPNGLPQRTKRSFDSWNWNDWGKKDTIDNTVVSDALYFMGLTGARKIAAELGESGDLAWYDQRIEAVKEGFNKAYWAGSFYSTDPATFQDDRANALAILTGLADPDKHASIVENVLIPNQFCSPHYEWMVEAAMCIAGRHDAALERMRVRHQPQVDRKNLTTLHERFPAGGSYNHAWNAANAILAKHIVGAYPSEPGWAQYHVAPNLGPFTEMQMVVPSVIGDIAIDLQAADGRFALGLVSPEGTEAVVGVPKATITPKTIRANGSVVWEAGTFVGGQEGIAWHGETDEHLLFTAAPGTWAFVAEAE